MKKEKGKKMNSNQKEQLRIEAWEEEVIRLVREELEGVKKESMTEYRWYGPETLIPRLINYYDYQQKACERIAQEPGVPEYHVKNMTLDASIYKNIKENLQLIDYSALEFQKIEQNIENAAKNNPHYRTFRNAADLLSEALSIMNSQGEKKSSLLQERLHGF